MNRLGQYIYEKEIYKALDSEKVEAFTWIHDVWNMSQLSHIAMWYTFVTCCMEPSFIRMG